MNIQTQRQENHAVGPQTCHTTDPDLAFLRAWQRGDERAFEELVRKNKKHAFCTALRITRNVDDAEDAVQESFIKVYRKLSSFEGRSHFSAWLTRIVVNASLGILRKRGHRWEAVSLDNPEHPVDLPDLGASPDDLCYCSEFMSVLESCLEEMNPIYSSILILQVFGGKSLKQTATAMRMTPEAVKTRCFRARSMLKKAMNERIK